MYLPFSKPTDTHLGQILVELNPNNSSLGNLFPCYDTSNPEADEYFNKVMIKKHGPIIRR